MKKIDITQMLFSDIYLLYLQKAERSGHTKEEIDEIIFWLTGYNLDSMIRQVNSQVDLADFFYKAPHMNEAAKLITGSICGIRVEDITDPLIQEIRYLDKLVDELANNKPMNKILRHPNKVSEY